MRHSADMSHSEIASLVPTGTFHGQECLIVTCTGNRIMKSILAAAFTGYFHLGETQQSQLFSKGLNFKCPKESPTKMLVTSA